MYAVPFLSVFAKGHLETGDLWRRLPGKPEIAGWIVGGLHQSYVQVYGTRGGAGACSGSDIAGAPVRHDSPGFGSTGKPHQAGGLGGQELKDPDGSERCRSQSDRYSPELGSHHVEGKGDLEQAASGGAHCNPSYWGPSLSGYSGSV